MHARIDCRIAEIEHEIEQEQWRQAEEEHYFRSQHPEQRRVPASPRERGLSSLLFEREPDPTADIFSDIDE